VIYEIGDIIERVKCWDVYDPLHEHLNTTDAVTFLIVSKKVKKLHVINKTVTIFELLCLETGQTVYYRLDQKYWRKIA
jgi:hypothetical protein